MDEKIETREIQSGSSAGAGLLAGFIAGIVFALVAMFRSMDLGMSFWLPMQQVSGWFFGVDALLGGWIPTVVGIAIHLALSSGFGLVFGFLASKLSMSGAFWAGIFYGIAIWAVMTFVVLPALNPTMLARVGLAPTWWFGLHLIFGAVLSLASPFARNFARHVSHRTVRPHAPRPATA